MIIYIVRIIDFIVQLITLLVIVKVFLSYFMLPYHPVRMYIDRFVEPMLLPLRSLIKPVGMLDLSPILLIVIVQILGKVVVNLLISIS